MRIALALPLAALAAVAGGCIPSTGPLMSPGQDCLECHGGGGGDGGGGNGLHTLAPGTGEDDGPRWTYAGTVYPTLGAPANGGLRGARVIVTDANGRTITLETNQAGNFYTAERMVFPLRATVEKGGVSSTMRNRIDWGGCNGCHAAPPSDGAPGRLTPAG